MSIDDGNSVYVAYEFSIEEFGIGGENQGSDGFFGFFGSKVKLRFCPIYFNEGFRDSQIKKEEDKHFLFLFFESTETMRRLTSPILSNLSRSPQPIIQNLSRTLSNSHPNPLCHPTSPPPPPPSSISAHFVHSRRTPSTFRRYPFRNITTETRDPDPHLTQNLEEAEDSRFESVTTTEEILESFKALESTLGKGDEIKYGLACLKVGQHLDSIGFEDREKTLGFAERAFRILSAHGDHHQSIMVVMSLHLLGSVSYGMKRFNDSLGFLNKANKILTTTQQDSEGFDVKPVIHAVQLQLANTKTAMGRREEAITNLRRCLELKDSIFGPDSTELGVAYRDLAEAYIAVLNFKEALPLCMKASEIHVCKLGSNSVEVAHDRRLLGVIYTGLEEHQKALEQNQLSQKVMRNWGLDSDFLNAEIEAANMQIALGKYDEAMTTLRSVVQQMGTEDISRRTRVSVYISMARALCSQEKTADAKRCLEISSGILEKKEHEYDLSAEVAEGYADIAEMYETMSEFETAISLLKRSISLFEKVPREQYAQANAAARIGWLLLLTGKVAKGIPYLESAAEGLKESFGPKHYAVGYIYNNLGAAYLEVDRPESAAQMFALAKDIMDVSLGCHHADSIGACQNLANAYDAMGNYGVAMEFQQRVVDGWRGHGSNGEDKLQVAENRVEEIERKISGRVVDVWEEGQEPETRPM